MDKATLFYKKMFKLFNDIYDKFININGEEWCRLSEACDSFTNKYPCVYCDELAIVMLEEKSRSNSVNNFGREFFDRYEEIFIKYQDIPNEATRKSMVKECNLLYKDYPTPFCLALGKALIDEKQREMIADAKEPEFQATG